MTMSRISDSTRPSEKDLCAFLAEYSASLLAAGATCIRLEKNVGRIADFYGMQADMTVMPRHIHISVTDCKSGRLQTCISTVRNACADFSVNTALSRLSWEIADGKIAFGEAVGRYKAIMDASKSNPWVVLLLVSFANASFCRLFGGDFVAMCIVAMATFAGFYLKKILQVRKVDFRLVFMLCSLVSSVIGCTGYLFGIGSTPAIAVNTSVLYLVPGIPFLNSFSDMLYQHYLCAFSRLFDAAILTCCISVGLCICVLLMNVNIF